MAAGWNEAVAAAQADERAIERIRAFEALSREEALAIDVEAIPGIDIAFSKPHYMEAVRKIQHYIAQGDVFQVNLSVRQSRKLEREPEQIYEWLRLLNPSPYMGLLRFPDYDLVSGSPELLVKSVGGVIETRPIAGTRPRGGSEEEDNRLARELIDDEKERAEHIMLVDLLRNDLGRVSQYGTVKVTDLMVVEHYSHVMHIVSHVQGQLASGKDAFDVIAATFPGGTITGAPKIRTMEIIEELEPVRRGPYTGSIGWIDYNGNMELNIVIRTLVVRDGIGYVQSGAGVVIDSKPDREYTESLNKAKALWKAILYSENTRS
jgi:para-aminobenzoate synthetase component 1